MIRSNSLSSLSAGETRESGRCESIATKNDIFEHIWFNAEFAVSKEKTTSYSVEHYFTITEVTMYKFCQTGALFYYYSITIYKLSGTSIILLLLKLTKTFKKGWL